jgi:S1-C subfamily serine protease
MRKLVCLCVLSGIAGGFAAVMWFGGHAVEPQSVAQETSPWSPTRGNVPAASQPNATAAPEAAEDQLAAAAMQNLTPDEQVNVMVYRNVNRSVVNINTKGYQGFLSLAVAEGAGSGSIIDRQGNILTNFHVIDGAEQIQVTLFDSTNYPAKVVGVDPATDVAVLKINAPPELLNPVVFGSSSNLLVGQRIFAIGNPFGLERTLTTGIISSLNRSLPARRTSRIIKSVIQIDAAINPGNSGGPLLDTHGLMIGMNTAIASKTGESAGVGFAIPVNTIARIVPQLIQSGHVQRPESGIIKVYQTDRGLMIITLEPNGPALKAGLHELQIERKQKRQGPFVYEVPTPNIATADFIVAVDGKPVRTADDFLDIIETKRPGDQVTLSVARAGKQIQIPLKLEAAD